NNDSDNDDKTPCESPCRDKSCIRCPDFRRFTKATDLELFYDLFFVANLTVFTYVHEINDCNTLEQYVGFFSILWFTWYQVSMYDVRFAMDSVLERVFKAVQFLVMMGFAICASDFRVGEQATSDNEDEVANAMIYLRALTIVLFISRMVLMIQYLQTLWFARHFHRARTALAVIAGVYFVAGFVYLGMYWTLHLDSNGRNHTYIIWYVFSLTETIAVTATSCYWRNISFDGTHLVERMSLLTLIILGEGAIATAKACLYIVYAEDAFSFTGSVAAVVFCAVLNLYFLYMIYFDWIHEETFGTIRQQIWSVLHFPLHAALVLAVEGASQCITWTAATVRKKQLVNGVLDISDVLLASNGSVMATWNQAAADLSEEADSLLTIKLRRSDELSSTVAALGYYHQVNASVIPTILNGTANPEAGGNAIWWITGVLYNAIYEIGGFYAPESPEVTQQSIDYLTEPLDFSAYPLNYWRDNAEENISKSFNVFTLTFVYFFIATGVFVIMCAVLAMLNRGRHTQYFWTRLAPMVFLGLALALMSTMIVADQTIRHFLQGPWILPTITFTLFAIVVLNSVKLPSPK
ncbi:hypothetical protein DOTSEDRAFT_107533, partial [Dothistroma septosporum NZE10]